MQSSDQSVSARPSIPSESSALHGSATETHATEVVSDEALEHIHLPPPTIWPITTAAGVTLGFMGLLTTYYVSYLGLIIAAWGVISWIQELRHELH
jgi:hypothetical protein